MSKLITWLSIPALAALMAFAPQPLAAQPTKGLPADLALIPGDAVGFAHVRVAEIWKSEAMKESRALLSKAGARAFETLDKDFTPAPSTIDRVTTVVLTSDKLDELKTVTILAFNAPFDVGKVKKQFTPKGEELKANGKSYSNDANAGFAIHFADDRTLVFGDKDTMPQFLKLGGKADERMAQAIQTATKKPLVGFANVQKLAIPKEIKDSKEPIHQAIAKLQYFSLTADTGKEVSLAASLEYADEATAKSSKDVLKKLIQQGNDSIQASHRPQAEAMLFTGRPDRKKGEPRSPDELPLAVMGLGMLAGLNNLDEFLSDLPISQEGKSIVLNMTLPEWTRPYMGAGILAAGVALPAVQKARNAAARSASLNNLKQIGLAMHNYHDTYGTFPPAAIVDKKGKKLLSWRVAILPFIEQDNLYKKFKLDQAWDSEHNKPFSDAAVKTFMDPRFDYTGKSNHTHYKVFVGGGSPFEVLKGRGLFTITDGTSNTLMVVSAGDSVPWAKPDDFDFDPKKDVPDVTKPFEELLMLFCDGSVRGCKPAQVKDFDKLLKLLIQADDGNPIWDF